MEECEKKESGESENGGTAEKRGIRKELEMADTKASELLFESEQED
jgi:hypothetical protein